MAEGTITRRDIIEDDALNWGADYAKTLDEAIVKNKEFVETIVALNAENQKLRNTTNQKEYLEAQKKVNTEAEKALTVWKEQNQLELALISTRKKNELATEATNKALIKERLTLAETNKELKIQARNQLGMVSAYEKLNRARLEAQKRLAELLSAEKQNVAQIIIAQREFDMLDVRVKAVDASLKNYSKNIGNYSSAFEGFGSTFRNVVGAFGLVTGVALFGQIVKDVFNVVKDFDRQLIAVGKTTNITGDALKKFGAEVVDLGNDLDGITVDGLIASAEVAGQLGVQGTDNILKFSSAIEKLKLTSNIISDEQVGQFAKFIEVSSDSFENADKLASVITQLGNSFATTESEVLANSTEIQKGVAVYNTSAQAILALGAATSTLGSEAEASRSAIQTTFAVINNAIATGKNLQEVLKITNLTQKELSKQFSQDATGVFVKFVKGLNDAKNEGQNLALVLNDLDITEKRAFTVIGALAANYGVLENAISQANQEYIDNAALNKEVAAASESISSIVGDLRDKWEAYVLQVNSANKGSESLASALKFVRDNFSDILTTLIKVGAVLLTYLGVVRTITFVTTTWNAIQAALTAAQIRFALATGIGTKAILEQAAAARAAAIAQGTLNTAMTATPWGVILGAIAAVVVAYKVFNDTLTEVEESQNRIASAALNAKKTAEESAKVSREFYEELLNNIQAEFDLKRKVQGESIKLNREEIDSKKKVAASIIETNNMQIKANTDLLEKIRTDSNERIRIAQAEAEKLRAIAESVPRAGSELAAKRAETELIRIKEDATIRKNNLIASNNALKEENKKFNDDITKLEKDRLAKEQINRAEEDKKAKAARLKRLKELYDLEKKAADDEFKLLQFRLQVAIDADREFQANEKASYDDRLDALSDALNLQSSKYTEALAFDLAQLGKYNENTGKLVREMSDLEIKTLIETGESRKKLTAEQQLIYERYQNAQTQLLKKGEEDRKKLVDAEVTDIQKRVDAELLAQDTALNQALEAENILYQNTVGSQEKLEAAQLAHEKKILDIKRTFAKDGLDVQIKAIEELLARQDALPESERISAQKRAEIDNELSRLKRENSDIDTENFDLNNQKTIESEIERATRILEISNQLSQALTDLTNAIFDNRIQKIDDEIAKNNEYYDRQIELANNDERQKDLLQKERDKKNDELEKKKRKEQQKQAVFNKASALVQASISASLAILAALNTQPFLPLGPTMAALASVLGAVQIAAIAATPIPKYKTGRKGGPAEIAEVGDGYVREVISRSDGSDPILTPAKPTLVRLKEGDMVHKTEGDYEKFMRRSILNRFHKQERVVSAFDKAQNTDLYGKESLEVMKKTLEAIKKQKTTVIHSQKLDINHHLWKMKQTNWN